MTLKVTDNQYPSDSWASWWLIRTGFSEPMQDPACRLARHCADWTVYGGNKVRTDWLASEQVQN